MTEKLKVTYRKTADLIPYARNARTHSAEQVTQIASSIREFGFCNPVLVDEEGGIIAGHGRVMAAKKLGMDEVPTIELAGLSEAQKRAYILADNKIALNSGWDEEMLNIELEELKDLDFDLSLTGFEPGEIDSILATSADHPVEDENAELPEAPEEPKSKRGDVWILGVHRCMCGDSCNPDDMQSLMGGGGNVSLYLTDPPYNVAYTGRTKDSLKIQNDEMDDEAFRRFLVSAYFAADSVLKPGAAFYIWHAGVEGFNFCGACRDVGWKVRECLVWVKKNFSFGRQDYQWRHEPCLYGWKDGASHSWYSDRSQTTVIECEKPQRNGEHPTMKPVKLFKYLMENSSKHGDIVLDSFGGSGTTLIAAEELGRVARVMELDPRYCDVIVKRWQNMTGQKAIRESDGALFDEVTA